MPGFDPVHPVILSKLFRFSSNVSAVRHYPLIAILREWDYHYVTSPQMEFPMPSDPEKRIQELHLTLPPAPKPVAVYKTAVKLGNMLYVSGHGPLKADKSMITGRLGQDMNLDQGKEAARQVGLAILATVKDTLGSLNKVKRLVKTLGMVNCTDGFADQPKVINGFSELMKDVFGEDAGVGARSAVGHNSLPGNIAVEIECIFEVE
jgi:enamine deaminase RidA (YjgF/YER057c/UK114 family)